MCTWWKCPGKYKDPKNQGCPNKVRDLCTPKHTNKQSRERYASPSRCAPSTKLAKSPFGLGKAATYCQEHLRQAVRAAQDTDEYRAYLKNYNKNYKATHKKKKGEYDTSESEPVFSESSGPPPSYQSTYQGTAGYDEQGIPIFPRPEIPDDPFGASVSRSYDYSMHPPVGSDPNSYNPFNTPQTEPAGSRLLAPKPPDPQPAPSSYGLSATTPFDEPFSTPYVSPYGPLVVTETYAPPPVTMSALSSSFASSNISAASTPTGYTPPYDPVRDQYSKSRRRHGSHR